VVASHLSKFPFFQMKQETVIWSAHYLWPYDHVDSMPESILLHLKFMDDFVERTVTNVAEDQHWNGCIHYREISETLEQTPDMTAFHGNSRRYRGPKSLLRYHLMKPLPRS
jgi:hypothetical protein